MAYLVAELARAYMRSGRDDEAIAAADRALPIAEQFELFEPLAESLNTKGTSLTSIGRLQEGIALLRGALAISEAHGLVRPELRARQNLWFSDIDDPIRAMEVLRPGLDKARRLGLSEWVFDLTVVICRPSTWLGVEWDWVEARLDGLRDEGFPSQGDRVFHGTLRAFLAAMREDPEQQVAALGSIRAEIAEGNDTQWQMHVALDTAWAHLAAGSPAKAFEQTSFVLRSDWGSAWQAWAAAVGIQAAAWGANGDGLAQCEGALQRATGRWAHALRVEIGAARAALAGDRSMALTRYREAFSLFRDLGMPLLLATSVIGACRLLGSVPELAPAIAEASEILTGLRAVPLLGQLEAARQGAPSRVS